MAKKKKTAVNDLQKGVQLLEIVAAGGEGCSLSALSRQAGISRYKTVQLLTGLEEKGLVECAVQSGRYDAGRATTLVQKLLEKARDLRYGGAIMKTILPQHYEELHVTIVKDARPVLESLARRHNEAIYMAILSGEEVLFLDMADSPQQEKADTFVGKCFPYFTNAAGKVMRAMHSFDLLEKIGGRWRGGGGGRGRHPDLAALRAELEQIREKGVAIDCSGMGEGIITVAVAVRDYAGKVVGALMMLGPSVRLLGERLEEEIIPSLRVSAEALSMKFGYARP